MDDVAIVGRRQASRDLNTLVDRFVHRESGTDRAS
jgi:hypothetical protein